MQLEESNDDFKALEYFKQYPHQIGPSAYQVLESRGKPGWDDETVVQKLNLLFYYAKVLKLEQIPTCIYPLTQLRKLSVQKIMIIARELTFKQNNNQMTVFDKLQLEIMYQYKNEAEKIHLEKAKK